MGEQLTIGLAAVRIGGGVQCHHLAKLCDRKAIPFVRIGRLRVVNVADLKTIRAECERRASRSNLRT